MNWGHKIIIVFILGAAGIVTLVVKSMRTRIDMVTVDYYAEELQYQQNIDAQKNAHRLTDPVIIAQTSDSVEIIFPQECLGAELKGEITFYRPSDSRRDFSVPVQPDEHGKVLVDRLRLDRGNYRIKVQWELAGTPYFLERQFFVQ